MTEKAVDLDSYLNWYLDTGDAEHKGYHPVADMISGILDITIIKPVLECELGKDLITGEYLTEYDIRWKQAGIIIDFVTLGGGSKLIKGGMSLKEFLKASGKTLTVDALAATATYGTAYVGEELGLSEEAILVLSTLAGVGTSYTAGKAIIKDAKVVVEGNLDVIDTRNINGHRTSRYKQLSDDEISQLLDDIEALEADPSIFRFNEGNQTGFLDSEGIINVRGDVLPDVNSNHPRDLMSPRAVLAHEYYGHKHFDDVFCVRNPLPGSCNDEFRASYNAAINAPNLSDMDRMYLMLDALERAKEAGVNITITDEIRRILYGY